MMFRELYGLTDQIDEKDFEKRKTNIYAVINDTYFMKVKRKIPEELYSIDGIFCFYFCRVRKVGDKQFKIEGKGITHKIFEEIMLASSYLAINDERDELSGLVRNTFEYYGEYPIVTNSYVDKDGAVHKFVAPAYDEDFLVNKPKKLSLKN
jgi:hypothetical protein